PPPSNRSSHHLQFRRSNCRSLLPDHFPPPICLDQANCSPRRMASLSQMALDRAAVPRCWAVAAAEVVDWGSRVAAGEPGRTISSTWRRRRMTFFCLICS
ncbi:hypothetical protein LINPERPRIM_LOCUS43003, partial [Linum perenne]